MVAPVAATSALAAAFECQVAQMPDRPAVRIVSYAGSTCTERTLTYAELHAASRGRGAWLAERVGAGQLALLAMPTCAELVELILGGLLTGIAISVLPEPASSREGERLAAAVALGGVGHVVTTSGMLERTRHLLAGSTVPVSAPPVQPGTAGDPGTAPGPGSVALVQFTSGSTTRPRGVVLTHAALAHNTTAIVEHFRGRATEEFCSWLPLHHDMGLIGQLLTPLLAGGTTTLMTPEDFIRHPMRWIDLLCRYDVSFSAAPPFALELCVKRWRRDGVAGDLGRLRALLVGAEPVHADVLRRFAEAARPLGLRAEAIKVCYGLAEASLFVSGTPAGLEVALAPRRRDDAGSPSVSCGVSPHLEVIVVDPTTRLPVPDGQVGEVWVAGDSVAAGYWRDPVVSASTFAAYTATGRGPYLRTGDGGWLHAGELVVSGRLRAAVSSRGRLVFAEDVERLARGHHAATSGLAAALVEVGGEGHLVLIQELRTSLLGATTVADLSFELKSLVTGVTGLTLHQVLFVGPGAIPKTTSGKVQRHTARVLATDRVGAAQGSLACEGMP